MANRLEAAAWDLATNDQPDVLAEVPYVRVEQDGEFVTSSRLEAHRLCGAAILDSTVDGKPVIDVLVEKLGLRKDRPLNYHHLAASVARLDR